MNVGLEEIDFDDSSKNWSVTVGFSRPWDYSNKSPMTPTLFGELSQPSRAPSRSYASTIKAAASWPSKDRTLTHPT